jgi:SAM-dependent methyltransferase
MGRPQDEMAVYYDLRAAEFDAWWETPGPFAGRERPGWDEELAALTRVVQGLSDPGSTLDVGCGTGYVTRLLPGPRVVGLDRSPAMLSRARLRLPKLHGVRGDCVHLPFSRAAFGRVFTSHVYGHLLAEDRAAFLAEARRVGREPLVVVDAGPRGAPPREEWQERSLSDGSRHRVYKRFFSGAKLLEELGGGRILHDGHWFVAASGP